MSFLRKQEPMDPANQNTPLSPVNKTSKTTDQSNKGYGVNKKDRRYHKSLWRCTAVVVALFFVVTSPQIVFAPPEKAEDFYAKARENCYNQMHNCQQLSAACSEIKNMEANWKTTQEKAQKDTLEFQSVVKPGTSESNIAKEKVELDQQLEQTEAENNEMQEKALQRFNTKCQQATAECLEQEPPYQVDCQAILQNTTKAREAEQSTFEWLGEKTWEIAKGLVTNLPRLMQLLELFEKLMGCKAPTKKNDPACFEKLYCNRGGEWVMYRVNITELQDKIESGECRYDKPEKEKDKEKPGEKDPESQEPQAEKLDFLKTPITPADRGNGGSDSGTSPTGSSEEEQESDDGDDAQTTGTSGGVGGRPGFTQSGVPAGAGAPAPEIGGDEEDAGDRETVDSDVGFSGRGSPHLGGQKLSGRYTGDPSRMDKFKLKMSKKAKVPTVAKKEKEEDPGELFRRVHKVYLKTGPTLAPTKRGKYLTK